MVVGRQNLPHAFQAREVVVVSHSRFKRGRWCWWVCRLVLVGASPSTYHCSPIPTLVVALPPLPAILVMMVVVDLWSFMLWVWVSGVVWCGGGGVQKRVVMWHQQPSLVVDAELNSIIMSKFK